MKRKDQLNTRYIPKCMTLLSQSTLFFLKKPCLIIDKAPPHVLKGIVLKVTLTFIWIGIMDYFFHNKREVFLLMFMIVYKKMVETENTTTMTTANKRKVSTRCHRTEIIVERKTYILYILKMTRIFWDIATWIPSIFSQRYECISCLLI